ncbi:MAG TPA: hypothetical protein VIF88_16560, partial [Methylocystis sp.]
PAQQPDGSRKALAEAIEAQRDAESQHAALVKAEQAAFDRECAAEEKLETIQRRHAAESDGGADAFVASIASGSDCSVDALEAPGKQRAAEIEAAQREIAALDHVRRQIVARVEPAEKAVAALRAKVERCAAEVLVGSVDVQKLLAEAERAAQTIVGLRVRLMFVRSLIPSESPEHAAVDHFLARPWLIDEYSDAWKRNPAIAPYRAAFEALCRDPEAKINCAP